MGEERVRFSRARAFELMCASIMGAFASKLFEVYWPLHDLPSQLLVGAFIILSLLLASFGLTSIVVGLENSEERHRHRRPP